MHVNDVAVLECVFCSACDCPHSENSYACTLPQSTICPGLIYCNQHIWCCYNYTSHYVTVMSCAALYAIAQAEFCEACTHYRHASTRGNSASNGNTPAVGSARSDENAQNEKKGKAPKFERLRITGTQLSHTQSSLTVVVAIV